MLSVPEQEVLQAYVLVFDYTRLRPASVREIAEKAGYARSTVIKHLRACMARGYVTQAANGKWWLTPAGGTLPIAAPPVAAGDWLRMPPTKIHRPRPERARPRPTITARQRDVLEALQRHTRLWGTPASWREIAQLMPGSSPGFETMREHLSTLRARGYVSPGGTNYRRCHQLTARGVALLQRTETA